MFPVGMFPDLMSMSPLPAARTRDVMKEFSDVYEQQYAVALFNSVRFEIEGGGGTQSQLLHRKASSLSLFLKRGSNLLINKLHKNKYVASICDGTLIIYKFVVRSWTPYETGS